MKRSPLLRKTPLRKRRPGVRRGQPTPEEKRSIRLEVYRRAQGRCELHNLPDCIPGVLPWDGGVFQRGHLVHLRSRGAGGGWTLDNLRWGCWRCHLIGIHQGKGEHHGD